MGPEEDWGGYESEDAFVSSSDEGLEKFYSDYGLDEE